MKALLRWILPAIIAAAVVPGCSPAEPARPLANGLYAVLEEAPKKGELRPEAAGRVVLLYDRKYSEQDRKEPPRYVALDTANFVPLVLAAPPEALKDERGWTLLRVTLAREHVGTLEAFTRKHLNGSVAIVLGGEIVTMHKVRAVIEDGKAVITRCYDNACQAIRTKLAQ